MPETSLAWIVERAVDWWLPMAVYGALPTIGVIAGPSYAPLVFGLAVVQLLHGLAVRRRLPDVDRALLSVALGFVALCWASAAWSIVPEHSLMSALQMTGIAAAALVFLAARPLPDTIAERLFHVVLVACLVGSAIVVVDTLLGDPLESFVAAKPNIDAATKYNRGLDYLGFIVWPELAWLCWRRRRATALLLAAAVIVALALGSSLAGRMAGVAGAIVLALAWFAPRVVAVVLTWGTALFAGLLPFALRSLCANRAALVPYVKASGVNRLEIWDYMTARVLERPLLGWGISSASSVPIRPDELAHYVSLAGLQTYPHNQWLELWVETGALGAMAGAVLEWLVLRRIGRMPSPIRPFAYAAFVSAMTVSCINFEVTTDSWWAALAASGFLFTALGRLVSGTSARDRRVGWLV